MQKLKLWNFDVHLPVNIDQLKVQDLAITVSDTKIVLKIVIYSLFFWQQLRDGRSV